MQLVWLFYLGSIDFSACWCLVVSDSQTFTLLTPLFMCVLWHWTLNILWHVYDIMTSFLTCQWALLQSLKQHQVKCCLIAWFVAWQCNDESIRAIDYRAATLGRLFAIMLLSQILPICYQTSTGDAVQLGRWPIGPDDRKQ